MKLQSSTRVNRICLVAFYHWLTVYCCILVVKRKPALAKSPLGQWERWHISSVSPLICPLMDGENYNCVDWCEKRTSLESRWEVFSLQRWAVAELQQGELWSLASVIIKLSYRPPPPPPICTHYNAKPRHAIFPYAPPLGSTHAHSVSLSLFPVSHSLSASLVHFCTHSPFIERQDIK